MTCLMSHRLLAILAVASACGMDIQRPTMTLARAKLVVCLVAKSGFTHDIMITLYSYSSYSQKTGTSEQ